MFTVDQIGDQKEINNATSKQTRTTKQAAHRICQKRIFKCDKMNNWPLQAPRATATKNTLTSRGDNGYLISSGTFAVPSLSKRVVNKDYTSTMRCTNLPGLPRLCMQHPRCDVMVF
ncbi:MAG: hypothetical protein CMM01_11850 [Rhodopirellula sp.]|nr:hypothetical protein [Rhodopirellula sp.]OUX51240.1 MAG: hypothetical protein CBE43_04655 [Rhodopirellula sp. TMED283]